MPERIGKYEIRGELGKGGFGQVYLGFDPTVDRLVAIKVLAAEGDSSRLVRFRTEAAAAGSLNHRNIVTIHEFGEDKGTFFLVMEYLEGRDLKQIITDRPSLSVVEKMRIMGQVAQGLQSAHQRGIVHRDVKPANIMVLRDGTVKVLDFGIARLTRDNSARLTQSGFLVGTVSYMAPEQLSGQEADPLCDIWAFGTTYYELICGQNPFDAGDTAAAMHRILHLNPPPVRTAFPQCPAVLDNVIMRLIEKNRARRYQGLEDVLFDCAPILIELEAQQAGNLIAEARDLIRQGKLDDAQPLVRRILALDASREDARALRRELQAGLQRRSALAQAQSLSEHAGNLATRRDFQGAIQAMEAALQLDPNNSSFAARLEEFCFVKERFDKAERLLAEGRTRLEAGNLTGAFEAVKEALDAAPDDSSARTLFSEIEKKILARDTEQRLRNGLAKAKGLLALQSFDEALGILKALAKVAPESLQVRELLDRTRDQRDAYDHQRFIRSEIDAAKSAIKTGQFEAAVSRLTPLLNDPAHRGEVAELLAYAHEELAMMTRASKIKSVVEGAWRCLHAGDFAGALMQVEAGLQLYSDDPSLLKLRQTILTETEQENRRQAVQQALDESAALGAGGMLREAEALLERALHEFPGDAGLKTALNRVGREIQEQAQRERQTAFASHVREASLLLEQGQYLAATHLLQRMSLVYPGEAEVTALLERVQRSEKHRAAVDAIAAKIRQLLDSAQLERAREEAARGREELGAEPQLAALDDEAARLLARRESLESARRAWRERDWQKARTALEAILARDANDTEVREWLKRIRDKELEEQHEERRNRVRDEATRLVQSLRFDEAVRILRALNEEFPDDGNVAEDLRNALDAQERQQRREAYGQSRRHVDRMVKSGQFDEAIAAIEKMLVQFPDDAVLRGDLRAAVETKREQERRERYDAERRQAADFARLRRFDDAIRVLQALLLEFQNDPALHEDLKSAEGAKALQDQRQALDREVELLEKFYRRGDAHAVAHNASALPPHMKDARVRELLLWANNQLAQLENGRTRESAASLQRKRHRRIAIGGSSAFVAAVALLIAIFIARRPPRVPERLAVSQQEIDFSMTIGDPVRLQSLVLRSSTGAMLSWRASVSADWLLLRPNQGSTPADLTIAVDPARLGAGENSALVSFSTLKGAEIVVTRVRATLVGRAAGPPPPDSKKPKGEIKSGNYRSKRDEQKGKPAPLKLLEEGGNVQPPPPPPPVELTVDCSSPDYTGQKSGTLKIEQLVPARSALDVGGPNGVHPGGVQLPGCPVAISSLTRGISITELPDPGDAYRHLKIQNGTDAPISGIELHWERRR